MLPIPEGLRHWPSSTVWNLPLAGSRPDAGQRMKIGDNASRSFFTWSFWDFFASDRAGPHVLNIPHGSSSRTTAHFDFPHFIFFISCRCALSSIEISLPVSIKDFSTSIKHCHCKKSQCTLRNLVLSVVKRASGVIFMSRDQRVFLFYLALSVEA